MRKKSHTRKADLLMASAVVLILGVLLIPIPAPLLDFLLVVSLATGILIVIYTLDLKDPLDFSSFPAVLLLMTLFRLALNVATTRQILLKAYAGDVIQAFGDFVIGGNYIVGIVVFSILVIINFMVITKGSGRIAEVAARFTLDAMPGKQMSIDADLNQGVIDEKTAIARRQKLTDEADFYGAMDGASKFVRGDAVAGLIITVINIGAGFAVGMLQQQMRAGEALKAYTILTVGDGLVSQIPAVVVSTAAGILVTRVASEEGLGTEVARQLFFRPKPLMITGGILASIGIIPGLPFLPFVAMGGGVCGLGWSLKQKKRTADASSLDAKSTDGKQLEEGKEKRTTPADTAQLKNVLSISPMDLEIGFGLVPLVDRNQGGKLIDRISLVRTQIAEELGFVLPPVNVRDNVHIKNTEYTIKVRGIEVAKGNVRPGSLMAIDPSGAVQVEGYVPVREPAFGFKAYWIPEQKRETMEAQRMTVVDSASVVTTHLAAIAKQHAAELLTRQDVSELVEQCKEANATVVDELIPGKLTVGAVHRVLQALLRERVPIRDLPVILETLADHAGRILDTGLLVEWCRRSLGGHICQPYVAAHGKLRALGLHPNLEALLQEHIKADAGKLGQILMDPALAQQVLEGIESALNEVRNRGLECVLLCSPTIRPHLSQLVLHRCKDVSVLSFAEVPETYQVDILDMVAAPKLQQQEDAVA